MRRRGSVPRTQWSPALADTPDPNEGIQRFLSQWSSLTRAEALHLALQSLRDRVEPDRVLACEFAWEVHSKQRLAPALARRLLRPPQPTFDCFAERVADSPPFRYDSLADVTSTLAAHSATVTHHDH